MKELRLNLFAGTEDEDAHGHVQRVLEITDLFHIIGVTHVAIMLRMFPVTLMRAARRWKNMLHAGSIKTWDLLEKSFIRKYCPPLKLTQAILTNEDDMVNKFKAKIEKVIEVKKEPVLCDLPIVNPYLKPIIPPIPYLWDLKEQEDETQALRTLKGLKRG
ncbi:hypothetical protein Tco_0752254 [Tanacetum coccineum]|uniref:Retrotransposon gag domain-containing protein n=1 Tax=Tanacetum coccineum TaxID=301880 RepID=A0ABQ4Z9W7_9ASTR